MALNADKELVDELLNKTLEAKLQWKEDLAEESYSTTLKGLYTVTTWRDPNFDHQVIVNRADGAELFRFVEKANDQVTSIYSLHDAAKRNALGLDKAKADIKKLLTDL